MNFEEELEELITAAFAAGIDRDTIISALTERAVFLEGQETEEGEDKAYHEDVEF